METRSHGSTEQSKRSLPNHPAKKYTIIGAGMIGYIVAYHLLARAVALGEPIRISMQEKNDSPNTTTAKNVVPSLTIDEIVSVVPPAPVLNDKLSKPFNEPEGIRVDDVKGIHDSRTTREFLHAVKMNEKDPEAHKRRVETLLQLGRMSMESWQEMFDEADDELKAILIKSNFQPCREPQKSGAPVLHDGYRVDLIYNIPSDTPGKATAIDRAKSMCDDYQRLGYNHCEILSPDEVVKRDSFLADFCAEQSELNSEGKRVWKKTASALWRPGGCIDTQVFLPLFHDYLTKVMGTYINEEGKEKNCFQRHLSRNVVGVTYEKGHRQSKMNGLVFFGQQGVKKDKHAYQQSDYIFCTGENVGALDRLGLPEPEYARFAGASLMLNIKIPPNEIERCKAFNHCMEVHQEGVVLAWQARFIDNTIFIGGAGTKAFYGDKEPQLDEAFAKDRNLLQLNMMNDVLPEFLSWALKRNTKGEKLTAADLEYLKKEGIAKRWVGSRAVAFDGFPTLGHIAPNASCIGQAGSGGGSFAHGLVRTLFKLVKPHQQELMRTTLEYGNPERTHRTPHSRL